MVVNIGYIIHVQGQGYTSTFSNMSVISRRSVLEVEEIGVPGEKHRSVASH